MPPAAFVEQLRLDCARTLLEAGELSKTVADKAGFGSQDRLGREFNRAYAVNPSTYRALHHKVSAHVDELTRPTSRNREFAAAAACDVNYM
jgi:transcriptional regulator GlxA family with amidase domain